MSFTMRPHVALCRTSWQRLTQQRMSTVATASLAATPLPGFNFNKPNSQIFNRPKNNRTASLRALQDQYATTLHDYERLDPEPNSITDRLFTSELGRISKQMLATTTNTEDQATEMMTQCSMFMARHLFSTWKAFDLIPARIGSDMSFADLAAQTGADEGLIRRLASVLVSHGILAQPTPHALSHTPKSLELREGHSIGKRCQLFWEVCMEPFASTARFFKVYGRKEPQRMNHVPSSFAAGTPEDTFYGLLHRDPERTERFGRQMRAMEVNMPSAGIYDFNWLVAKVQQEAMSPTADHSRAVFVDVGGGMGQATKAILAENPALPASRFILQDQSEVLQKLVNMNDVALTDVAKMTVNFHQEQPVKGAHIYFIRRCLFNFPDPIARNMLRILSSAMLPHGESRLLIQEDVMDVQPNTRMTAMDMIMLGLGGKQRSLEQWEKLASEAGLRVVRVHRNQGKSESLCVVECVKDETYDLRGDAE